MMTPEERALLLEVARMVDRIAGRVAEFNPQNHEDLRNAILMVEYPSGHPNHALMNPHLKRR